MDIFNQIAERKIQEAIARGEFDNLPNRGQKIDLQRDPFVPFELQMGYKLLKNAGVLPEELALKKEIQSLHDLLAACPDQQENPNLRKTIRQKLLMINMIKERNGCSVALQDYQAKIESINL